jgi:creatinine amidohydrolase
MRLERMRPAAIRDAIAAGLPLVLPLGVLEYHGEHLPCGMDLLAVTGVLDRLEVAAPDRLVLAPPFPYGAASHAVAGPAGSGTLQVGSDALHPFARALFAGLLRIGFRNIHAVIHHQTENFAQGMPTDLAFRLGAREAIFAQLERDRGEGWWGAPATSGYYEDHARGANPFNWVQVHPLFDAAAAAYPFDHAGPGETALMLALAPGTVAMDALDAAAPWYTAGARAATAALGEAGVALALARLRGILGLPS